MLATTMKFKHFVYCIIFCANIESWLITTSKGKIAVAATTGEYDLRWTSEGGGWLAMMANVGFAKLFQKVGLWNDTSCSISAMTGWSGGTWFFTQFMFSQSFYNKIHDSNQDEIYQFVINWMDSFIKYQEDIPTVNAPVCNTISPLGLHEKLETLSILCKNVVGTDGSWATFIDGMFQRASTDVYNDTTFVKRRLKSENRVSALSNTELHTVGGISPTATVFRDKLQRLFDADTITYISPNQNITSSLNPIIFTLPISTVHVVKTGLSKNDSSFLVYATEKSSLPLYATVASKANSITRRFNIPDWEQFYLYPGTNGTVYRSLEKPNKHSQIEMHLLRKPFGGKIPTVSQIHGMTSAATSLASTAVPSILAQFFSTIYYDASIRELLLTVMKVLYKVKLLRDLSVCSQWPKPCTKYDSRFIDGGLVDGIGLAWSIGQYQTGGGDLNKTLKILATSNNDADVENIRISAYFNTSYNQNVEPGSFTWAPRSSLPFYNPWRSIQIFNTHFDYKEVMSNTSITTKIIGSQLTLTTSFIEATTLDNPLYGIVEGQKVQILLLQVISKIPTKLFTLEQQKANTIPLAELATAIMSNSQLYDIVVDFLENK